MVLIWLCFIFVFDFMAILLYIVIFLFVFCIFVVVFFWGGSWLGGLSKAPDLKLLLVGVHCRNVLSRHRLNV